MKKIDFNLLSNSDINIEVGRRLKMARLNADLSQSELAALSGLSESTVKRAESGQGNTGMMTVIAILRALKKIDQLDLFLPEPPPNPIQLSASKGKAKQRASRSSSKVSGIQHQEADLHEQPSSGDSSSDQQQNVSGFEWGEES